MIELGDLATWASAAVAVVAAGVAAWQTREARRSRIAAEKQATEAARSSTAAETQARAAQEQLALMRAERDDRDAPMFKVSAVDAYPDEALHFAAKIVLHMESGPALESMTVAASGRYLEVGGLAHVVLSGNGALQGSDDVVAHDDGTEVTFDDVRQGRTITFYASAEQGYVGSSIAIDLTCRERDGARTWQRHYACPIDQRPEQPRTRIRQARINP